MQRRQFLATAAAATALAGCHEAPRTLQGGFAGIDLARGHALRDLLQSGTEGQRRLDFTPVPFHRYRRSRHERPCAGRFAAGGRGQRQ